MPENIYEGSVNSAYDAGGTIHSVPQGDKSHNYTDLEHGTHTYEDLDMAKEGAGKDKKCCQSVPCWCWAALVVFLIIVAGTAAVSLWFALKVGASQRAATPGGTQPASKTRPPDPSLYEWGSWTPCMCQRGPRSGVRSRSSTDGTQRLSETCAAQPCYYLDCHDAHLQAQPLANIDISPDGGPTFSVACDQQAAGGGWTIFQKRDAGDVSFNRGWSNYRRGFGARTGDHWLGNEFIYRLTHDRLQAMRVVLLTPSGEVNATYGHFDVAGEADLYRLEIGDFIEGLAGSTMAESNNANFSTPDDDNDGDPEFDCALYLHAGWWYGPRSRYHCGKTRLNAVWLRTYLWWNFPEDKRYFPTNTTMMVRPRTPGGR